MERIHLKEHLPEIAMNAFLFLFAIEPAFEDIGNFDYVIWTLMLICIVVTLGFIVQALITDKKKLLNLLDEKKIFTVVSIAISISGLTISLLFHSYLYKFWAFMLVPSAICLCIPDHPKKKNI